MSDDLPADPDLLTPAQRATCDQIIADGDAMMELLIEQGRRAANLGAEGVFVTIAGKTANWMADTRAGKIGAPRIIAAFVVDTLKKEGTL